MVLTCVNHGSPGHILGATVGTAGAAAFGIAVSPIPAITVAALLGTEGPLRAASAFVAGQAIGIFTVVAIVVAASADSLGNSLHSALGAVQLGISAILALLLIAHLRRGRDRSASSHLLASLDGVVVRPGVAFVSGVAMVGVNPKNLALAFAGAAAIVDLDASWGANAVTVVAFTALASSILLAEVLAYRLAPRRTASLLARGRAGVMRHERGVVTAVLLGLALLFFTLGLATLLR